MEMYCRDKITMLFLSEILNRLGVVDAGKVILNVSSRIDEESDAYVREVLHLYICQLKKLYMGK
ncbi:DUF2594 family protein [Salmonella enterica subsp. enterica serovar Sandiego]|nr:DUF2594 family protein [Salmonella enterica subsp. enterica serovar Sandiego]EEK2576831.1 DUF2594 family protein [Salmonella enterica subsp. enterica serovar Montevideo]